MSNKWLACILPVMFTSALLGGCTSDPYAPVNQSTPIRQMDNTFDPSGSRYYDRAAPPAQPGYYQRSAPTAYPPSSYEPPAYPRY
ncbi:MAG: hypothetical protein QOG73_4341 [Acetobacteraceae bacterium]|jgi:hypothetical protein|nr:hypothetical protein [Acetobacteraceae bacterium]